MIVRRTLICESRSRGFSIALVLISSSPISVASRKYRFVIGSMKSRISSTRIRPSRFPGSLMSASAKTDRFPDRILAVESLPSSEVPPVAAGYGILTCCRTIPSATANCISFTRRLDFLSRIIRGSYIARVLEIFTSKHRCHLVPWLCMIHGLGAPILGNRLKNYLRTNYHSAALVLRIRFLGYPARLNIG